MNLKNLYIRFIIKIKFMKLTKYKKKIITQKIILFMFFLHLKNSEELAMKNY